MGSAHLTTSEQLTANFYRWEQRGRGWSLWDLPVELEPPFQPFHHTPGAFTPPVDDGRKHTFFSALIERFRNNEGDSSSGEALTDIDERVEPRVLTARAPMCEVVVSVDRDEKSSVERVDHILLALSACEGTISFEIIGTSSKIDVQFACSERDLRYVQEVLRAYLPNSVLSVREDSLAKLLSALPERLIVDFGLSEEFMRPIKTFKRFDVDPLTGIIGTLENLESEEVAGIQVLFQATQEPWAASVLRSVSDGAGGSFFFDDPEMLTLAREKIGRPLFAVVVRLIAGAQSSNRTWEIARALTGGLEQVADTQSNELIPLTNEGYDDDAHIEDVVLRCSHRCGMLLNSDELVSLVHTPSPSVHSERLRPNRYATRAVPSNAVGKKYVLGENIHFGKRQVVSVDDGDRLRHMYVVGATGTGKSTLLLNLIRQDMEAGNGIAVLDPHGDLIDQILGFVPDHRVNDVIVFDPSDSDQPVGLNILTAHSELERNVLASDVVAGFRRLSSSWGDQMTSVLGNAVQTILESSQGGTLADLRRLLLDEEFRSRFLETVSDEDLRTFWVKEFPKLRGNPEMSVLTRLEIFLRPKLIRNIVSQKAGLDLTRVLREKKLLFAKLAQGLIGEENTSLLGTLLVSKIHQAAMARQEQRPEERDAFYLYIDEFQNFLTPSMSSVISGSRKYGLGLILAHQELRQLWDHDTSIANSVISNPSIRVCFRLGDFDAEKMENGFAHFSSRDFQNLGIGEAIARVDRADQDFNLNTVLPPSISADVANERHALITKLSRERFGFSTPSPMPKPEDLPRPQLHVVSRETLVHKSSDKREKEAEPVAGFVSKAIHTKEERQPSQHRYLQSLIKKMAEDRGFRAVVEEPTLDGRGRVDVGLDLGEERIACEISVTTDAEQEIHNIRKCLSAGYTTVIVCSPEKKNLGAIRTAVETTLAEHEREKVKLMQPDELFRFLDERSAHGTVEEKRVSGYRVKVHYQSVSDAERSQKREAMANVVLQTLRRMKSDQ